MRHKYLRNIYFLLNIVHFEHIKENLLIFPKIESFFFFSNYNYCQFFLNADLSKRQYGILLTQIYMIMRIIKDMKYNELIGVTEQQFGKDEEV